MKDERWLKEQISPELLDGIAGGMTEEVESSFRESLKNMKNSGMSKGDALNTYRDIDFGQRTYDAWETSQAEMLAYIEDNWDSL